LLRFLRHRATLVTIGAALALTTMTPGLAAATSGTGNSHAAAERGVSYRQQAVIKIPGAHGHLFGDIIVSDRRTGLVYFSDDAGNAIDVMSARSDRLVTMLTGFTGGPAGVITDNLGQLWASDPGTSSAGGTVRVYSDRAPFGLLAKIHVGAAATDEIAYDPHDQVIIVTSPDAVSPAGQPAPYVTLISARRIHGRYPVLARVRIPGAPDGAIEQPQWDPRHHVFVEAVRTASHSPGGEIAIINPRRHKVQSTLPLRTSCHPAGLAVGLHDTALLGCDIGGPALFSLTTGRLNSRYSGDGGCCTDEVWFDRADQRYYAAEGGAAPPNYFPQLYPPTVAVISARDGKFLTNITLGNTALGFHQVTAIGSPAKVFVPESDGIHVFVATCEMETS
jgi:hypothetical protein